MAKAAGYIVVNENGKTLELSYTPGLPRGGMLMHGDNATFFPTYASARCALKKARKFADKWRYDWKAENWKIKRLLERA